MGRVDPGNPRDEYASGTLLHRRGEPVASPQAVRAEMRAAILAVVVGVALMGIKFAAYFLTGSAAIFSDAMEGIVNVAAAAFATYAIYHAHRPPDIDHPYGHGKIEFVAAGFEGGMILLAAVVAVVKAVDQLLFRAGGPEIRRLDAGIALMVGAAAANLILGAGLVRFGKARQSLTLEADGRHLLADVIT
ncbi:MAG TPA: cation diffusion facilitator family transporter, partial [Tepidisphaeraceae bacterium]|nr:cation diffusion facilitator family transporter [Tepidisphaeraceae bacterium]